MKIVVDATTIIALAKGNCFHYLQRLFIDVYIPIEIKREVIDEGKGRPGEKELRGALGIWVRERKPREEIMHQFSLTLSEGDRQVLALAKEIGADYLLTDDGVLQKEADRHGIACLKTPELLVLFKAEGLISAVRPVLDLIISKGFGVDHLLYQQTLRQIGEIS